MPELIVIFWFMLIGGAIGSFLNVVIYRLPNGMSLVRPGSHCPKCGYPIRWYDNVPVFGWGALGGKCRDCKAPISFRYPLVETICAILFGIFTALVFCQGETEIVPKITWEFARNMNIERELGLVFFLCIPVTTILAVGMIEFDNLKVPLLIFIPTILVIILFAIFTKDMLFFYGKGLLAGIAFALLMRWFLPSVQRLSFSTTSIVTGCVFGLEGGVYIILLTIPIYAAIRFISGKSCPGLSFFISIMSVAFFSLSVIF